MNIALKSLDLRIHEGNEEFRKTVRKIVINANYFGRSQLFCSERMRSVTASYIQYALPGRRFRIDFEERAPRL
jgi:hypothetical protein